MSHSSLLVSLTDEQLLLSILEKALTVREKVIITINIIIVDPYFIVNFLCVFVSTVVVHAKQGRGNDDNGAAIERARKTTENNATASTANTWS